MYSNWKILINSDDHASKYIDILSIINKYIPYSRHCTKYLNINFKIFSQGLYLCNDNVAM